MWVEDPSVSGERTTVVSSGVGFTFFFLLLLLFFIIVVVALPLPIILELELVKFEPARKPKRGRPPHGVYVLGVVRERDAAASVATVSASVD